MSKVLVNESSLTGIADAIRGKNGSADTYKPSEMAAAITAIEGGGGGGGPVIEALSVTSNGTYTAPDGVDGYSPVVVNVPQDGSPPEEAFTITGDCDYKFKGGNWDWFVDLYANKINTTDITSAKEMFRSSKLKNIPFELNFNQKYSASLDYIFADCANLENIPKINNCQIVSASSLFYGCKNLRSVPDDFESWFDWNTIDNSTSMYSGNTSSMFFGCSSLRSVPMNIFNHGNKNATSGYAITYALFDNCNNLDEIVDFPIAYSKATSDNIFYLFVDDCNRLKNLTFAMPDGQPYVKQFKKFTLDLTRQVGYYGYYITFYTSFYNSGITEDKKVDDDVTYQALKNDPDWFTTKVEYSRYNHDSAVATINSLPDTSAYLATAGGTNTIKFKGESGSATDGGAISSLTPDEIAVATAKGWSVSLV